MQTRKRSSPKTEGLREDADDSRINGLVEGVSSHGEEGAHEQNPGRPSRAGPIASYGTRSSLGFSQGSTTYLWRQRGTLDPAAPVSTKTRMTLGVFNVDRRLLRSCRPRLYERCGWNPVTVSSGTKDSIGTTSIGTGKSPNELLIRAACLTTAPSSTRASSSPRASFTTVIDGAMAKCYTPNPTRALGLVGSGASLAYGGRQARWDKRHNGSCFSVSVIGFHQLVPVCPVTRAQIRPMRPVRDPMF